MSESLSEGEITLFSGGWREGTEWERQGEGNAGDHMWGKRVQRVNGNQQQVGGVSRKYVRVTIAETHSWQWAIWSLR